MRLPRFRVRTLMVAVAVVAVALGLALWGVRMLRLRAEYLAHAALFAREEAAMRKVAEFEPVGFTARFNLKRVAMMRNMRLYYERLARYPWLPDEAGSAGRSRRP